MRYNGLLKTTASGKIRTGVDSLAQDTEYGQDVKVFPRGEKMGLHSTGW